VLRGGARRFAGSAALGDVRFQALDGILRRETLRLSGHITGTSILSQGKDNATGPTRAVAALDAGRSFNLLRGLNGAL
jgi:hypothetical protein